MTSRMLPTAAARILRAAAFIGLTWSSLAISVYKGIQPGKSTRDDVSAAFGQPVGQTGKAVFEYAMGSDQGKLFVEFRADSPVVDRIERAFARPVSRAALRKALNLPDTPEERETRGGKFIEYYGGLKILSLTFASADAASGVTSLNYYSFEMYDRLLNRARNIIVKFDPAACRDLYYWSQTERDVAKRAKNTPRHQAVLEIQIIAERGDCDKARTLAAKYRERYR